MATTPTTPSTGKTATPGSSAPQSGAAVAPSVAPPSDTSKDTSSGKKLSPEAKEVARQQAVRKFDKQEKQDFINEYGKGDDDDGLWLLSGAAAGAVATRYRRRIGFFRRLGLAIRRGIESGKKTFRKLNGTEEATIEAREGEKIAADARKGERLVGQVREDEKLIARSERASLTIEEGAGKLRQTAATLRDLQEAERMTALLASTEKLAVVTEKLPTVIRTAVALTTATAVGVGVGVVGAVGAVTVGLAGSIVVGAAVTAVVVGGVGYLGYRWLAAKGGKSAAKADADAAKFGEKALIGTFKSQTIGFAKDVWSWGKTLFSDPKKAVHEVVVGAKDAVTSVETVVAFVSDSKLRDAAINAGAAVAGGNTKQELSTLLALNSAMAANKGVSDGLASIGKEDTPTPAPQVVTADTHESTSVQGGASHQNAKSLAALRSDPRMSPPVVASTGPAPTFKKGARPDLDVSPPVG